MDRNGVAGDKLAPQVVWISSCHRRRLQVLPLRCGCSAKIGANWTDSGWNWKKNFFFFFVLNDDRIGLKWTETASVEANLNLKNWNSSTPVRIFRRIWFQLDGVWLELKFKSVGFWMMTESVWNGQKWRRWRQIWIWKIEILPLRCGYSAKFGFGWTEYGRNWLEMGFYWSLTRSSSNDERNSAENELIFVGISKIGWNGAKNWFLIWRKLGKKNGGSPKIPSLPKIHSKISNFTK